MFTYSFTLQAVKDIKRLPKDVQKRIIKKLDYFVSIPNPLLFADALVNFEIGQYRFRVGDYRIIFDIEGEILHILTLGHRREIYR